jgi:hypothetical protein
MEVEGCAEEQPQLDHALRQRHAGEAREPQQQARQAALALLQLEAHQPMQHHQR